jgi:deoxyxylulose-5-phosphate synthase
MWKTPCPVFVRGIGMEGSIGPVATGMHHSMVMRMPGFIVASPMTPSEWEQVWNYYLENQQPVFCSEHRTSFNIDNEIENIIYKNIHPESKKKTKATIFSIGAARLESIMAFKLLKEKNINVNVINLIWLKPLKISDEAISLLKESEFGVVIDSDFHICGASEHIANFLMIKTSKPVYALGLEDRTSGFAAHCDNLTPNAINIANSVEFEDFVI